VASLNELVEEARRMREESASLRTETVRLKRETALARRLHVASRRTCEETTIASVVLRERVPTWPAWCGPTKDLRLTLVLLESPGEA
jgi:hypothetical protein